MDTIKKSIEIYDAKISFVSLVDRPANRRAFLLTKSEDNPGMMSFSGIGRFLEKDTNHGEVNYLDGDHTEYEQHYVTGVAYEPNVADTDDNFMTEDEIEKMAHWFMKNGRMVDEQHSFDPDPACHIVESWIAPQDLTINDQPVSKGTWLVKVEVDSPDVWTKIEAGDITGFSIGGLAKYGTEDVDLDSNTPSGEEGGDAAVGENNPEIKSEEKRGLWIRLAKALGLAGEAEYVEKGAVMDRFAEQTKSEGFWNAFHQLQVQDRQAALDHQPQHEAALAEVLRGEGSVRRPHQPLQLRRPLRHRHHHLRKMGNDEIWLADPKNLITVSTYDMKLRRTTEGKDAIQKDERYYAIHGNVDYIIEETEAAAIATGITTSDSTDTTEEEAA